MAAKRKEKLTADQITKEVARAAKDYEHLCQALWSASLTNLANRLGVQSDEVEEEFAALT